MTRSISGTVATALLTMAAACGGSPEPPGPTGPAPLAPLGPADRLYSDNGEGITDSVRIVIRDPGALQDVWARATRHQGSPVPPPNVNFEEHMVVVVGAGRMTPQDRIRVDSVGVREVPDAQGNPERVLFVRVRTIQGCQQLDLEAYPVEIVRVPHFEGPVRFTGGRVQDPNCQAADGPASRPAPAATRRPTDASRGPSDAVHRPTPPST